MMHPNLPRLRIAPASRTLAGPLFLVTCLLLARFVVPAAPVTLLEYKITGSQLSVSPAALSVPKGVAGSILVQLTSGGSTNTIPASAREGVYVTAILRGPAFPARQISGALNAPLLLPPLNLVGDYEINDIKLIDAVTGRVQLEGVPNRVPVHVFEEVLVSQVTSRPLSLDEMRQKGITVDEQNFRAVEFEVGFVLDGKTVPVRFPVVAPTFRQSTEIIPKAELEAQIARASLLNQQIAQTAKLPRELETAGLNIMVQGINFQAVDEVDSDLQLSIPPIPALVVIPGSIGFLNQFFSVQVFTENGAPIGSGLDVNQVTAQLHLPPGPDLIPSTNYDLPGDDPLRFARVGKDKVVQPVQPVVRAGPDGQFGTPDDVTRFHPGESGRAEFLVEGLQEGLHVMDIDLTANLEGLAAGAVKIGGKAAGSVLVRNPRFSLTFTHPRTTRQGEPYDATVTVLNTGNSVANLVKVTLPGTSISGGQLLSDESVDIGTLQPGESGTAKFRVRAQRTGRITFSNLTTGREATAGAFQLTMGIDERGVALSPDSIEMPDYVTRLPQGLVDAANRVLGQALSVATAAQLPPGVQAVPKSIITTRVLELAEAGQRLQYGDDPRRVLMDLLLDWQGGRDYEAGFDQILRVTDAGREWRTAMALAVEATDTLDTATRMAGIAPDVAGRSEAWLIATANGGQTELRVGADSVASGDPQPQATAPAGSGFYSGQRGSWIVARPETGSTVRWLFASNLPPVTLSVIVTGTNGAGRSATWTLATPPASGCAAWAADRNPRELLSIDPDCSGSAPATSEAIRAAVVESAPRIVAVVQDLAVSAGQPAIRCGDSLAAGSDNYGTVVAVLFSKPMNQALVNVPGAYTLDNSNGAASVQIQPGGRVALLNLRQGVGAIRERVLRVTGIQDERGHPVSGDPVPLQATAADGVAVRGRVVRADGTPAGGIPVTLTYYDNQVVGLECSPLVVRVSQMLTDSGGLFDFDFVLTGVPYSVSATDTSGLGGAAVASILATTRADELQSADLTALIKANPDSLLAAFGTTVASEAVARAEGLDRALLRDTVIRGSPRTGTTVPMSLVFRGRAAVEGVVLTPDGSTPAPGTAVNLFPDPDSRELGRGVFADSNGRFAFEGVPLGVFTVAATNALGQFRVVSDFVLQPGSRATVTITLSTNAVSRSDLSGQVVEADNVTGHSSGRVFVGRYVDGSFGNVVAVATADSQGFWSTPGIPVGTYDVVAVSADGVRRGERRGVVVSSGALTRISIALQGVATVQGRVEDSHGKPVSNALVAGGAALVRSDALGLFSLDGVPTGHRTISAGLESDPEDPNSFARLGSGSLDVVGGAVNTVVVRLEARGTLFGRVLDAGGRPAPNVQVRIPQQGGFLYVNADAQGNYRFVGLAPDDYILSSSLEAAPTAKTDTTELVARIQTGSENQILAAFGEALRIFTGVDDPLLNGTGQAFNPGTFGFTRARLVDDGQVVEADIHFLASGSLSGVTLNGQGFRIGARVRLTTLGLDSKGAPTTVVRGDVNSDAATGEFSFDGVLPAGPWGLQAASPFFPVVISSSGQTRSPDHLNETNIVLQFPADQDTKGRLAGHVLNPDGSAAPAGVTVSIPSQPEVGTRQTDTNGLYRYDNVRQGGVFVVAEDPVRGLKGQAAVTVTATVTNLGDVRLLGKGTLLITVVQADGITPVAGAAVNLEGGTFPFDVLRGNATDNAGRLVLGNLFEGWYAVCAQAGSGVTTLYGRSASSVDLGATNSVVVRLSATASIAGRFLLRDGITPVPSAQIAIGTIGFTTTDANGAFFVGGIPLGTYRLLTQNPVSGVSATATVTLAVNNSTNQVTLLETSLGEVAGFVVGSYGTNLVPGATVTLRFQDGITPSRTVTTGGDGGFRFPAVPAGTFGLEASDPVRGLSGFASGTLAEGQPSATLNVQLEPLAALGVRVLLPDGVTPAAGVRVSLSGAGGSKDTASDGRAVFSDLRLDSYLVTAREVRRSATATNAILSQAGQRLDLTLLLPGTGRISGRVLQSNGTTPAAGAAITLTSQAPLFAGDSEAQFTGADGGFNFTNVAVGGYRVVVIAQSLGAAATGEIHHDGQADALTLTLGASGRVTGRVVRADGSGPVTDAQIVLIAASQSGLGAETLGRGDAAGVFVFDGVPVGTVRLSISALSVGGLARTSGALTANGQVLDLGSIRLDEASPAVVGVSPPDFSQEVPTTNAVELLFSEALDAGRLDPAGVFIRSSAETVASTLALVPDTNGVPRILRITPAARLRSRTVYEVIVVDGDRLDALGNVTARGPVDLVGRPLETPFVSRFATADNDPPVLVSAFPVDGESQVTLDAVPRLVFSEPIRSTNVFAALSGPRGAVAGSVAFGPNGLSLLFAPAALLEPNGRYTLVVSNVADLAGNPATGQPYRFTFDSLDTLGPEIGLFHLQGDPGPVGGRPLTLEAVLQTPETGARIRFQRILPDFQILGESASPPYRFATVLPRDGTVTYQATAFDIHGNAGTNRLLTLQVTSNQPPTVLLTVAAPVPDRVFQGDTITAHVEAADDVSVTNLLVVASGAGVTFATNLASAGPVDISILVPSNAPPGALLQVAARAVDFAGLPSSDSVVSLLIHRLNHRPVAGGPVIGPGGAIRLDGVDDFVSAQPYLKVATNFTMELWVNPTAGRQSVTEAADGIGALGSQRYAIYPDHGSLYSGPGDHAGAGISVGTNGVVVAQHAPGHLPPVLVYDAPIVGWTHLAVVFRDNIASLFVNGQFVRRGLPTGKVVHPSSGASQFAPYGDYQGELDELRIWNIALTETAVREVMSQRLVGTEPGLVACFRFDEPDGDAVLDQVAGGPVMTLGVPPSTPLRGLSGAGFRGAGFVTNVTALSQPLRLPASDADGDSLTFTITRLPLHARLLQTADGVHPGAAIATVPTPVTHPAGIVILQRDVNYAGSDDFLFIASDGASDSFTATSLLTLGPTPEMDSDGDGLPDAYEIAHGLDAGVPDASLDKDGDGWSNLVEFQKGTDPSLADSDGDGIPDPVDPDPLIASLGAIGLEVQVYATVPDPVQMAFAPDGTIYTGRDASGSGGGSGDAVKINRVAPGGATTDEFGNAAVEDPDGVVFDATGSFSGAAGSVLVAGSNGSGGFIKAVRPDGSIVLVAGPSGAFVNPQTLRIDSTGRLLFLELGGQMGIWSMTAGNTPVFLAGLPNGSPPVHMALDSQDRIYVSDTNGLIRVLGTQGAVLDPAFATVPPLSSFVFGNGGVFGRDLWVISGTGELTTLDAAGTRLRRLVGLWAGSRTADLGFGADGALYVADFQGDRVLRIAPAAGTNDVWDVHQGTRITATTGAGPGPLEDMFGQITPGQPEPGNAFFADSRPAGFVHSVEWRTAGPVFLTGFHLSALSDGVPFRGNREFQEVRLFAIPAGETAYRLLYDFTPPHPYPMRGDGTTHGILDIVAPVVPLVASDFRLECVQAPGSAQLGPRILELEGFGTPVDLDACRERPTGLVHYYSGDQDASDLLGAPTGNFGGTAGVPGKVGGAIEFNGSDSGLEIGNGNNPELDFSQDDSFAFETWFNRYGPSPSGQDSQALIMLNYDCSPTLQALVVHNDGRVLFQSRDQDGKSSLLYTPGVVPAHEWHHVAAVREVTNGVHTLRLYLDGDLVDTLRDQTTAGLAINAADWIGRRNWCGDFSFFFGAMDEVALYRRALTPSEVLQRYAAGIAGRCVQCVPEPPGLVAQWRGDGDAADAVGTLDGTASGGVAFVAGEVRQAFQFDGVSGAVTIPSAAGLSPHVGSQGTMTLSAWVYIDAYPDPDPLTQQPRRAFVSKGDVGRYEYALSVFTDGTVQFSVWGPSGGSYSEPAGGKLPLHGWHHVAGTLVKGQGARVYLDGTLVGQDIARGDTAAGTAPLLLGRRGDGSFFAGGVDEVSFFSRDLSSDEIAAIVSAGTAGTCAPSPPVPQAAAPPAIVDIRIEERSVVPAEGTSGRVARDVVLRWEAPSGSGVRIEMSSDLRNWVDVPFGIASPLEGLFEGRVELPDAANDRTPRFFRLRRVGP